MADTRKPKPKPGPTGKSQPGRGSATAAKPRPQDGRGGGGRGRQPDKGKLAKGAAARRLQEKRRRQRTLLWTGVAVLSLVALVALILILGRDEPQATNKAVAAAALQAGRQAAGSQGVKTYPSAGRNHISANQQPSNWNSNPPTSGDHLGNPLPPGIYGNDQDPRALVHNMEHGYVVILYKGIPSDQVEQLTKFVDARDGSKLVLAPYSGLPSNGVALAAWQNLETMQRVNLDVVQAFVNDYMVPIGAKSVAPEPNAA
jgi:type II secretory pathway pseudopilin PulG